MSAIIKRVTCISHLPCTTVNPLYNDICCNSKIRYNMNPLYKDICCNSKIHYNISSVCTKNQRIVYFFIDSPMLFLRKTYVLDICRDSNKYTKQMIHKKRFKSIFYSCFRRIHIKFLYNSKFDLTAKSLVTNTVVITRVLCITI